jgi:hypothetical protein
VQNAYAKRQAMVQHAYDYFLCALLSVTNVSSSFSGNRSETKLGAFSEQLQRINELTKTVLENQNSKASHHGARLDIFCNDFFKKVSENQIESQHLERFGAFCNVTTANEQVVLNWVSAPSPPQYLLQPR